MQKKNKIEVTFTKPLRLESINNADKHSTAVVINGTKQRKPKKNQKTNYAVQQSKIYKAQKSINVYKKLSTNDKKKKRNSLFDSIKDYIGQNWKKTTVIFGSYFLLIGLIVSTPVIFNNLRVKSQIQTDQERLIIIYK